MLAFMVVLVSTRTSLKFVELSLLTYFVDSSPKEWISYNYFVIMGGVGRTSFPQLYNKSQV